MKLMTFSTEKRIYAFFAANIVHIVNFSFIGHAANNGTKGQLFPEYFDQILFE